MLLDGLLEVCSHLPLHPLFTISPLVSGDILATAGDDGNVLLWVPSEHQAQRGGFGNDNPDDKETWIVKRMIRAGGNETYDLAWSPSGDHFIVGSMDNVARIIDAQTGKEDRRPIQACNHY